MSNFTHQIGEKSWVKIVKLSWEIDDNNIDELKQIIEPILNDQQVRNLIINIKDLSYINSIVIWWFAWKISEFNKVWKHFVFSSPNEDIFEIIDAIWLSSIIETYESDEECLLFFEK